MEWLLLIGSYGRDFLNRQTDEELERLYNLQIKGMNKEQEDSTMTENKNLRQHGEVTTRVMSEEERLEYIKKHPIIPTEKPKAGMQLFPSKYWM